ncbi:MAG: hypothetical protein ACLQIB_01425 [Isosphaeraceae bacterium]
MSPAALVQPRGLTGTCWGLAEFGSAGSSSVAAVRVTPQEAPSCARTTGDPVPWDEREFEQAPRLALRRVLLDVLLAPAQRGVWTERLLPLLFKGPSARKRLVYEMLREFADPRDILVNSLVLYHRYGDAEPMVIAAGLLEDLGARSWSVLSSYLRSARPECAYFVPAVARINGVALQERLDVLEILARSADPEVRWRVYEALDEFPLDSTVAVLRALANDSHAQDSAQFAAQARLRPDAEA